MKKNPIELEVLIERKQADLPRFAVIPSALVKPWGLTGTTVIELQINSQEVARRTIKYWDADRWFISFTASDCARLQVDSGDRVKLKIGLASSELPAELATLLKTSREANAAWARLTPGQQRQLREEIEAAKQSTTRERRARKTLLGE